MFARHNRLIGIFFLVVDVLLALASFEVATPATWETLIDDETLADWVAFLHWHETYHVGQLELLRQLAGTNDKII